METSNPVKNQLENEKENRLKATEADAFEVTSSEFSYDGGDAKIWDLVQAGIPNHQWVEMTNLIHTDRCNTAYQIVFLVKNLNVDQNFLDGCISRALSGTGNFYFLP